MTHLLEKTKTAAGRLKVLAAALFLFALCLLGSCRALAANTGWVEKNGKLYYYKTTETEDGQTSSAKVKGLQKIGSRTFYFDEKGVLQTAWQDFDEGFRYFKKSGAPGVRGMMYSGYKAIGNYHYYFDESTGIVKAGLTKVDDKTYFFSTSKKFGTRGRATTNKWKAVGSEKYYFGSDGAMVKNSWVEDTWYVDGDGKMLKDTVTPDDYLVDAEGKKVGTAKVNGWVKINGRWRYYDASLHKFLAGVWKTVGKSRFYLDDDGLRLTGLNTIGSHEYYFSSSGVMQTGLQTIKNKQYYFDDTTGRMLKDTTYKDYVIDEDGVITNGTANRAQVLIIAGHGQGDPGAGSTWGQEQNFTRQFAKLIYQQLVTDNKVDAEYYKNGSTSFDCYQQNVKTFGSGGLNIANSITGKGTVKSKVASGLKKNANLPDFTKYDYVLEVHFNATASSKDPQGNGSYMGSGFYINSYKTSTTLENAILNQFVKLGFKKWGNGIFKSGTLFNCRICQELGVSYGLLETAFIDDGDDMKFYNANRTAMAKAVAAQIEKYVKK